MSAGPAAIRGRVWSAVLSGDSAGVCVTVTHKVGQIQTSRCFIFRCQNYLYSFSLCKTYLLYMLHKICPFSSSIDKAIHSLGYKSGYALPQRNLPNPVDIVLVFCQKVTVTTLKIYSVFKLFNFCSIGVSNNYQYVANYMYLNLDFSHKL